MEDEIDWYVEAHLCLRSGVRGKKAVELFQGQIGEAIHAALGRPDDERPRLYLICEKHGGKLPWGKIVSLAARSDFPVIV